MKLYLHLFSGGGICYALFIAQLTYPNNYLLYFASALIGVGAALIWVAQVYMNFVNFMNFMNFMNLINFVNFMIFL